MSSTPDTLASMAGILCPSARTWRPADQRTCGPADPDTDLYPADHGPRTTDHGPQTTDHRPQTTDPRTIIGTDVHIQPLTADQLDGAFALSTLMGWNQRLEDWRRLIELAPSGSFVARDHNRVVGTAIGIHYVQCGWIAMMLVAPEYRGRGLGARLLEAAMAAVPSQLPLRLDATPLGRPLYE